MDTAVPEPHQRVVVFIVNELNVVQRQGLVQYLLVERHREAVVDELTMKQCLKNIQSKGDLVQ